MKVDKINIKEILPGFMQKDEFDCALADELSDYLNKVTPQIDKLSTWKHIDNLSSAELDALAAEIYIPWYDSTAPNSVKANIIKHSNYVWAHIGTREAMQSILNDIYTDAELIEWFQNETDLKKNEYSIYIPGLASFTADNRQRLLKMLSIVQRASQHLKEMFTLNVTKITRYVDVSVENEKNICSLVTADIYQENSKCELKINTACYAMDELYDCCLNVVD